MIMPVERIVHHRQTFALGRAERRRVAARIEDVAAGIVERQAEAEAAPLAHLGDALEELLAGQEIEATELVVDPEIAPGRAGWSVLPTRIVAHLCSHAMRQQP